MADTRRLTIEVLGDAKGALSALDDVGSRASRIGEGLFEFGKKLAIGFAAVTAGGAVIGKQLVDSASDLNEVTSKTGVVFGDASDEVTEFAQKAATAFGQSQTSALNAASTFGTFGKAAGLTGKDLATFSTDFGGLASDLASFSNTTPEEAVEAIGAALRGEAEPIRKYGVLLDDATLKQKALELGIYNGKGALTQQQKVLAAQAAIFDQTTDAQGDFARTSDGVANKQRILAAQFENVKSQLGSALLPAFGTALGFITDRVLPAFGELATIFEEEGLQGIIDRLRDKLPEIGERLRELGGKFVDWIKEAAPPALAALLDFLKRVGEWLISTGLPFLGEKAKQLGVALIEWIGPRIGPALRALGEFVGKAAQWFIDEGLPMLVDKLVALGNALVDWIGPRIGPALQALGEFLGEVLSWFVTEAIPKIGAQAVKLAGAALSWIAELLPKALVGLGKFVAELLPKLPGLFFDLLGTLVDLGLDLADSLVGAIVDGLKEIGQKGLDVGKAFVNGIIDFINREIIQKVNDLLEFTIDPPGPGKITLDPPDIPFIPKLAAGGIVSAPTLALIGESGPEAVVPLSRGGAAMGATVNVTVNGTVVSERDLIESIRVGLLKAQKSGRQVVLA